MAEIMTSPSASTTRRGSVEDVDRLAACYNCKRSKLKCVRAEGSSICVRCRQRRQDCNAPAYHVGRHKGVKNKHSGLEKAVCQIQQALKKSNGGLDQVQNVEQAAELRQLLERSRELLHTGQSVMSDYDGRRSSEVDQASSPPRSSISLRTARSQSNSHDDGPVRKTEGDQLNLDDAENPLQLLARTSELLSSISPQLPRSGPDRREQKSFLASELTSAAPFDSNIQKFFGQFQPRLDIGSDLDPIELGLLSIAEAEALFSYFHENLAHTRWGIDPVIHTVDFVRGRSAFLLTSIAAASALFCPSMESLYKRLSNHRQKLADLVMARRYKSVEIVLAFMVNIPWISAGEHWADDETSTYMSMALTVALDLSLNKAILPAFPDAQAPRARLVNYECISATKALAIDGFGDLNPNSILGRRLLRRRERTWLALFVLERGVCLARGRDYLLPMSPLIESCDQWHLSELADRWDGSIVSVAVLRRDLTGLIARIRAICDAYADSNGGEVVIVDKLKKEINTFFDRWYSTWPFQIGDREKLALPPYVEILASHTRLSMYSSVINHATAPIAARHYFRAAGLSSALNVLRVAVQGEGQLKTMPNNTAIMISFAACFAMRVSTIADGHGSSLAPSIRTLILETTDALERIGSTPIQRRGLSCLFARQLREIVKMASRSSDMVRSHAESREPDGIATLPDMNAAAVSNAGMMTDFPHTTLPPDYLLFSTMSNDQLDAAINNTDVGLDTLWDDFQFQNGADLDWMDWSTFA